MKSKPHLTLYQREECPFCQLVRKKLTLLGLTVTMIQVEENGTDRQQLMEVSGQKAVPVLVDGEKVITDSSQILDYLQETYGSGQSQSLPANNYNIKTQLNVPMDQAVELTKEALASEGFDILSENKRSTNILNIQRSDHSANQIAIGICHPDLAPEILAKEPDLGLILPCKVVIRLESDSRVSVSTINPLKLLTVVARDDLVPLAMQLKRHLDSAIQSIGT